MVTTFGLFREEWKDLTTYPLSDIEQFCEPAQRIADRIDSFVAGQ